MSRTDQRRERQRPSRKRVLTLVGAAVAVAVAVSVGVALSQARVAPTTEGTPKLIGFAAPATEVPTEEPEAPDEPVDTAPLTGLPIAHPLDNVAVTVKISNTPDAHPHRGLEAADIVFVEPITGSTTRLAAIFHTQLPDQIGPVRSLRPMDAPIVGPTHGVLANTMAQDWVLTYIDQNADVANLGTMRVPRGTYVIDPTRVEPNHVFAQPEALLALTDRADPPQPYFSYADEPDLATAQQAGRPATSVSVAYGDPSTATWTYDDETGRWLRAEAWSAHILEDGTQVAADNVVVLRAARDFSFPRAGADMTVLDLTDASGRVDVFTGDAVVAGEWSKAGVNDPFVLTTEDGEPMLLTPGTTWVELALDTMAVTIGPTG